MSAWGVSAINFHCSGLIEQKVNPLNNGEKDKPFDVFEGFLDISGLLYQAGKSYKAIYDIFSWSEQLIYYLRRYDDQFIKSLELLSKIVSDIQGECFNLFKQSDVYSRAYILNLLCKFLYKNPYPSCKDKWDPLTKFLSKESEHHDLNRLMNEGELKTLAELHYKLHKAHQSKKLTTQLRSEAFLILSGRRFHYDYKFDELIKDLKLNKEDTLKLKAVFNKNKEDYEKHEKNSRESYKISQYSPLSIYGLFVE